LERSQFLPFLRPLVKFLQKFLQKLLKPRGYFIFCYDAKLSDIVIKELKENRLQPEFIKFVHPKIDRDANIILIAARKNSKAVCKVLPPFIVFDENGSYSESAKSAFKIANTYSIKAVYD